MENKTEYPSQEQKSGAARNFEKIRKIGADSIRFLKEDIWTARPEAYDPPKSVLIRAVRLFLVTVKKFNANDCVVRASALTYFTLLSVVPIAALAFGIASGFGFEKMLQSALLENLPGQEDAVQQVIDFADKLLQNTQGGLIAGIGIIVLFWAVIRVLGQFEMALNAIWEVNRPRSIIRKVSDYLSIMFVAPIFLIMSGSAAVFLKTQLIYFTEQVAFLEIFGPVILALFRWTPYVLSWILFTLIYMLMPHTKVHFTSAALAGVIAGSIYQIAQVLYINFQVGVSQYNAVYGSFAAFPLFLIWIDLSWLIVLFGGVISAVSQSARSYEYEPVFRDISPARDKLLSLYITHYLVKQFADGDGRASDRRIADDLEIPHKRVQEILERLVEAGILSEVRLNGDDNGDESGYQPARDTDLLTVKYILDALDHRGNENIPIPESPELQSLSDTMAAFDEAVQKSDANRLLKRI